MQTTAGSTPTIFIDGIAVIRYNNYSGATGRITNTLYIKKGQVISTRSDDIRNSSYNIAFFGLK